MRTTSEPHELLLALLLVQNSLQRRSESFFQPFGLTASQFNILNLLSIKGGKMDQLDLVDQLLVGKSSVSIVLSRMVRDGLIKRKQHQTDRRQTVLLITKKGSALWAKVCPSYEFDVKEIFGKIPADHRVQFLRDLKNLHEAISGNPADWQSLFPVKCAIPPAE
jgi:DNA-binding MarR family transcriptional regulator